MPPESLMAPLREPQRPEQRHVLRVRLAAGWVRLAVECRSDPGAFCRLSCAEDCGSVSLPCFTEENGGDRRTHELVDQGECNAALFIGESDIGAEELCETEDEFPLFDGMPVTVSWGGDGYLWAPENPVVA